MKTYALVSWGSLSALALTLSADGCGGRAAIIGPTDGGDDADSGSSSGVSGSSSGISGSSSGLSGSSSGMDGSSSGSSSGISGSSSGISGSSSGVSGSSSGVSGSSSGISSSSSGGANGTIYLEQCAASFCSGQSFDVYASFFPTTQGNGGCTGTTTGACTYYSCSNSMQQNGVSAGTLTVSGPWLTTPVMISPTSGTNDYQYMSSSPGYTAGQTLTVTASGAQVPAFGPESVVAPQLTQLTSPAMAPDGGTLTIPTTSDLPITWSGGQPGATLLIEAVGTAQDYTYCSFNGSDGQGVIPAAALKPFSGSSGYLIYGQYNTTSFFSGPYAISLTALPFTGGAVDFQ